MAAVTCSPIFLHHHHFRRQPGLVVSNGSNVESWKSRVDWRFKNWKCIPLVVSRSSSHVGVMAIKNQILEPSTFSSSIATDIPFYESPVASFDLYLEDKPRVVRAMFPDEQRSQQLTEDDWRIQMLPIQFLFATVWPEVDMKIMCRMDGKDYPPEVPPETTKVLELSITRWKLKGLDGTLEPSQFSLSVKGLLYPDRRGKQNRIKGQLEMKISVTLPPVFQLVPKLGLQGVAESVLNNLVENMKSKVNTSLLADYREFRRERPKSLV